MRLEKGFTLIELMIVVAIIGILSMMALPAYQDYTRKTYVAEGLALASSLAGAAVEHYSTTGKWPDSNGMAGLSAAPTYAGQAVIGVGIGHGPSGIPADTARAGIGINRKVSNIKIFYTDKVTGVLGDGLKVGSGQDANDPYVSPIEHKNSLTLAPVTDSEGNVSGSFQWVCVNPQPDGHLKLKWLPANCRSEAYINDPHQPKP